MKVTVSSINFYLKYNYQIHPFYNELISSSPALWFTAILKESPKVISTLSFFNKDYLIYTDKWLDHLHWKLSSCKSKTDISTQLSSTKHLFVPCARHWGHDTVRNRHLSLSSWNLVSWYSISRNYLQWFLKKTLSFHERDKWKKTLTASLRTSLFIGKICSIRTKGKREERISLSSSMSRSRLLTPLLFTLWAVPLSKFGSMTETENEESPTKSRFSEKGLLSSLVHFR